VTGIIQTKDGVRFRLLNEHDRIGRFLRNEGSYEPQLQKITQQLLDRLTPRTGLLIDAGANMGTYCLPLARHNPAIRVAAFEVQARVFAQLEENIALNALPNVKAYHAGLSDRAETVTASIPDYETEANIGAFSLDPEVRDNDYEIASQGGTEEFPLRTLDSFGFRDVLLLKVDVEGMEAKVLQGARRTLAANNFPPILFEAWTWKSFYRTRRDELARALTDTGYRITPVGENNIAQHVSRGDTVNFVVPGA